MNRGEYLRALVCVATGDRSYSVTMCSFSDQHRDARDM